MGNEVSKTINKNVSILWTGGWDSTYRMVELSRMPATVQPIYVYGDKRTSEHFEIRSMNKILSKLREREETVATLLPIEFVAKKMIPLNNDISDAYNVISQETNLGSQHEWLARLAQIRPGLEIGTEAASLEASNILTTIHKYGKLAKDSDNDSYILDLKQSSKELILLLGNFRFPIIDKTGQDMKANIELWGYSDVMRHVWVCHTPIYGKPCGLCHPCELKIETDMKFLLPKSAFSRYKNKNKMPFRLYYKLIKRINREALLLLQKRNQSKK